MEDEELFRLLEWLAVHPELGKVIPASGGLRKIRWAGKGRGKRGGVRIIYFWWGCPLTGFCFWTCTPKTSRKTWRRPRLKS
jgi:hypothetical protein